jgi:gas vesicle protein
MNKEEEKTNSGFLFGLTLGAAVGALSAILINKNNDKEIVKNFESKIKDFFQDLVSDIKEKKEEVVKEVKEIKDIEYITPKKPTPKMFVKPKK